ncbi:hypothetical protein KTJ54_17095 [Acinetobacter radioresistens]|uniref:hypothetical protein n=1 Tax=Acinetobacter radioresistens TaxID=40216 RepID=UPI0021CDFBCE|nr:hypothetical protein [Acinetobacter radioresistens]MCU4623794.1 hypothetical protein [Acinetobacter radioresistens]
MVEIDALSRGIGTHGHQAQKNIFAIEENTHQGMQQLRELKQQSFRLDPVHRIFQLDSHPTSHTPQRSDPLLAVLINLAHIQILVLILLRLGSAF